MRALPGAEPPRRPPPPCRALTRRADDLPSSHLPSGASAHSRRASESGKRGGGRRGEAAPRKTARARRGLHRRRARSSLGALLASASAASLPRQTGALDEELPAEALAEVRRLALGASSISGRARASPPPPQCVRASPPGVARARACFAMRSSAARFAATAATVHAWRQCESDAASWSPRRRSARARAREHALETTPWSPTARATPTSRGRGGSMKAKATRAEPGNLASRARSSSVRCFASASAASLPRFDSARSTRKSCRRKRLSSASAALALVRLLDHDRLSSPSARPPPCALRDPRRPSDELLHLLPQREHLLLELHPVALAQPTRSSRPSSAALRQVAVELLARAASRAATKASAPVLDDLGAHVAELALEHALQLLRVVPGPRHRPRESSVSRASTAGATAATTRRRARPPCASAEWWDGESKLHRIFARARRWRAREWNASARLHNRRRQRRGRGERGGRGESGECRRRRRRRGGRVGRRRRRPRLVRRASCRPPGAPQRARRGTWRGDEGSARATVTRKPFHGGGSRDARRVLADMRTTQRPPASRFLSAA